MIDTENRLIDISKVTELLPPSMSLKWLEWDDRQILICIEKMDSKESKRLGRAIDWNSLIYIRCDADEQFEWVVKDMIKELSE